MPRHTAILATIAIALTIGCLFSHVASAQWSEVTGKDLIITGGWLFDGTGTERIPNPASLSGTENSPQLDRHQRICRLKMSRLSNSTPE